MDDRSLLQTIEALVNEEHELRESAQHGELPGDSRSRLHEVEERLDQCWDLLRQRRGFRHGGEDPEHARVRDPDTVERYLQ